MGQFKKILPALAVLMLIGCGGGKIPPTHYYALDLPAAPDPAAQQLPYTVVVMPLDTSSMLTQDRIVYRPSREEVGYYEYHRWAEDPRESILDALISRLRASGAFRSVAPFSGRTRSDFVLRARIERLEEVDFEGGVKVYSEISAELLDAGTMRVVWEDSETASANVATADMQEVVRQLSNAVDRSIVQLVDSLAQNMRNRPLAQR